MATYTFYYPTIKGTTEGLIPDDVSLPTLTNGDVLDLATKTITFSNLSTRKLTEEQVKSYHKHRTVITLGGVGGVYDTLEILKDGSAIYTQNTIKGILNGTESWALNATASASGLRRFYFSSNILRGSDGICDKMIFIKSISTTLDYECIGSHTTESQIHYIINPSKLASVDVAGFKAWLQSNPITVCYQLAAPIVTHIPASLVPVIVTEQTNTFSADSAVKPSAIEVTVAVDKVSDLETRLQVVEAIMTSTSNLSLSVNYVEDEYVKNNQLEEELL